MNCNKVANALDWRYFLAIAALMLSTTVLPALADTKPAEDITGDNMAQSEFADEFNIALSVQEGGDLQGALELWQAIADRAPEASTPLANLSLLQSQLGNLDEAEINIKSAIGLKPIAAYYNLLGIVQRLNGKFADAKSSYEKAIEIDAAYAPAHHNIGILYDLYLNDSNSALKHYRRYQQLTNSERKEIDGWISDIERRIKVDK